MKELQVRDIQKSYRIYIDNNIDKLSSVLVENKIRHGEKLFIIADKAVYDIYKREIDKINNFFDVKIFCFYSCQENKNNSTVNDIYEFLIKNSADKNSVTISLGGEILLNLVGFVASTYMRGIRLVNIPTTLISQTSSCIGGENGYNYARSKTLIGTYYNPQFVFVATNFLKTLPNKEYISGLSEVVKYGIIKNEFLINYISQNYKHILERENDKLLHIVKCCLEEKILLIKDKYNSLSNVDCLDFGCTIANGIKTFSKETLSSGDALSLGILVTIKLSEKKFKLSLDIYNKIEELLHKLGLPTKYKVDNYSLFMYAIKHNNKNSNTKFVLLENINKCKTKIEVSEKDIVEALKNSIDRRKL